MGKSWRRHRGRLQASDAVQLPVRGTGAMQIRGLCWRHRNAQVVERQIAIQELIRRVERGDVREPHLLDPPILKGVKEPLHPPLGLGEWAGINSTPSSPSARPH
jgi:hypothetical protein